MHGIYYSPPFFSTHDLTQRSTGVSSHQPFILSFFNSRPHAEVDRMGHIQYGTMILFNSRPHAEVDSISFTSFPRIQFFNSRPHAEVDIASNFLINCCFFSTHDLTQRSTIVRIVIMLRSRSFQLTTSRRGRHSKTINQAVIYVFQLTTSRRGRLFQEICRHSLGEFSTHDLTQRSTSIFHIFYAKFRSYFLYFSQKPL